MHTHAETTRATRRQSAEHSSSTLQSGDASSLFFMDNRAEVVAQQELHELANSNRQAKEIAQLQVMVDGFSVQQQKSTSAMPARLQSNRSSPIQCQFYLQGANGTTTWQNEVPDTRKYEDTGATQRWLFWNYPVYKHKLLDSRPRPNATTDAHVEQARNTGVVPPTLAGEVTTTASVIESLNNQQRANFYAAYDSLDGYCRDQDKTKIVEGALTNVRLGALFVPDEASSESNRAKLVFLERFLLMVEYIKSVGDKMIGAGPQTIRGIYWIQSTGSDPHKGGHHALFLVNRTNDQKKLYKPHSLKFENAFVGTSGIIGNINKSVDARNRLPTISIDPDAHTEEFVSRVGHQGDETYTNEMLDEHSKKLGGLETISHVFGVSDLHAENILFGSSGPVPIDSEVGGSYPDSTGVESGLGPGKVDAFEFTTPSALYVGGQQRFINEREYATGKTAMANVIKTKKRSLLKNWRTHLLEVDTFRVIPIKTSELAVYLKAALNVNNRDIVEAEFTQKMTAFIQRNELAKYLDLKIVKRGPRRFWNILRGGTLPAFEFQMKTGCLLMDGDIVAVPRASKISAEKNVLKLSELARARMDSLP